MFLLTEEKHLINMQRVDAIVLKECGAKFTVTAIFDDPRIKMNLIPPLHECEARAAVEEIAEAYANGSDRTVIDLAVICQSVTE